MSGLNLRVVGAVPRLVGRSGSSTEKLRLDTEIGYNSSPFPLAPPLNWHGMIGVIEFGEDHVAE
ncbi:MAG TPA: hypothetical protein VNQ76_14040 [Planctomicrobium sp.]|nr:hypothetical protein [Planctomicrobium sp.]